MNRIQSKISMNLVHTYLKAPFRVFIFFCGIMFFQRCDPNTQLLCTEELRAGLSIQVQDGITGSYLADSVTIKIKDGNYEEELQSPYYFYYDEPFTGAYERPGNYQIVTSKAGYQNDTSYATVTEDQCHVITVNKVVKLFP